MRAIQFARVVTRLKSNRVGKPARERSARRPAAGIHESMTKTYRELLVEQRELDARITAAQRKESAAGVGDNPRPDGSVRHHARRTHSEARPEEDRPAPGEVSPPPAAVQRGAARAVYRSGSLARTAAHSRSDEPRNLRAPAHAKKMHLARCVTDRPEAEDRPQ